MSTYLVLEASEKLGISTRAVQKRCKKDVVRKKQNKYLITDLLLEKWREEIQSNELTNEPTNQSLNIADLQHLKLDDIEDFQFKFKRPGEFPKEGTFFFVPSEYDFAEYRPGEYADAEEKLQEWKYQKKELIEQKKTFENLIKSQKEQKDFYKGQLEYYQKLADRTLDMHSGLLETIQTQTKSHFIESTIRAKKTEWKKE